MAIKDILKEFPDDRAYLIQALHALQDNNPLQFLSEEELLAAASHFGLTRGEVFGVATYYTMFSLKPRGRYIIRFCKSPVCHMAGATSLLDYLRERWDLRPDETAPDGLCYLETTECIGCCDRAPAMMLNGTMHTHLSTDTIDRLITDIVGHSK